MEESGIKCWFSMSIFLSEAVSGAFLLLLLPLILALSWWYHL